MRSVGGYLVAALLFAGGIFAVVVGSAVSGGAQQVGSSQGVQADVAAQVSWGSASGCVQNMQANDFGVLSPGSSSVLGPFGASPVALASTDGSGNKVWVGCVTSNGSLVSVVAQGIQNLTDTGGDVLPSSNVAIGVTNRPAGQQSPQCGITPGQAGAG